MAMELDLPIVINLHIWLGHVALGNIVGTNNITGILYTIVHGYNNMIISFFWLFKKEDTISIKFFVFNLSFPTSLDILQHDTLIGTGITQRDDHLVDIFFLDLKQVFLHLVIL